MPHSTDNNDESINCNPLLLSQLPSLEYKEKSECEISSKLLPKRDQWGRDAEFLMSCIALSVGLGNVWRFPFAAYENGGGAFLIPYLIVLVFVGKPVYYLEMILGQFSSRGSTKVFDFAPALRGVGAGQVFITGLVMTYYAMIMAIAIRYILFSFSDELPWSKCNNEWNATCIDSAAEIGNINGTLRELISNGSSSSAEIFFLRNVLYATDSIENGIGFPNLPLVGCLAFAWISIAAILINGVKSSGKVAYFLAIFPYIVMIILLIRTLTLPGAMDGILFFLKPQWSEIFKAKVWYAAITQCFFSMAICTGSIIMYASYNRFNCNIQRDVTIVASLDTITSILSGTISFGVLGHLSATTGNPIQNVVQGGTGLAFVTYPDVLTKFKYFPNFFSVLFFTMLVVLGIGSIVGMASVIVTAIRDEFPKTKQWMLAISLSTLGFIIGCTYCTPGGQHIIKFLDFYGSSFVALSLSVVELIGIGWIYGVDRICKDIEFMLGIKTGLYFRLCWGIITPLMMTFILCYTIADMKPLKYNDSEYPDYITRIGWCFFVFGVGQVPVWAIYAYWKEDGKSIKQKLIRSFKPTADWGPRAPENYREYVYYINHEKSTQHLSVLERVKINLFGV